MVIVPIYFQFKQKCIIPIIIVIILHYYFNYSYPFRMESTILLCIYLFNVLTIRCGIESKNRNMSKLIKVNIGFECASNDFITADVAVVVVMWRIHITKCTLRTHITHGNDHQENRFSIIRICTFKIHCLDALHSFSLSFSLYTIFSEKRELLTHTHTYSHICIVKLIEIELCFKQTRRHTHNIHCALVNAKNEK